MTAGFSRPYVAVVQSSHCTRRCLGLAAFGSCLYLIQIYQGTCYPNLLASLQYSMTSTCESPGAAERGALGCQPSLTHHFFFHFFILIFNLLL